MFAEQDGVKAEEDEWAWSMTVGGGEDMGRFVRLVEGKDSGVNYAFGSMSAGGGALTVPQDAVCALCVPA